MRIKSLVSFPLNPLFLNLYTTLKAINQSVRGIKLILFRMVCNNSLELLQLAQDLLRLVVCRKVNIILA